MPQVALPIAAFFASATSSVLGAVGLGSIAAGVGAAVGNGLLALGFAHGIGSAVVAWGTVLALGSNVASMAAKVPKPASAGIQLTNLQDPTAGIPFAFGRTAVGGNVIYETVSGAKNVRLSRVVALSTGPIEEFETFTADGYDLTWNLPPEDGLGECVSTTAGANSKLFVQNFRQGYQYGAQPTIDPATSTGTVMTGIDANSKTSGIAIAIQHLDYSPDTFPMGRPQEMRWVIKGEKLYDPRKDSTYPGGSGSHRVDNPATYEWSENPYLAALNFVLGRYHNVTGTNTKVWGLGAPWSQVDVASFVHGANVADANGFKCGGCFSTTDDPYSVLNALLQAGSGIPLNRGAQISCFVNAPVTSIYSITEADVIGTAIVKNTTAFADRFNTIRYSSREESQKWQMWAGGSISPAIHVEEDGGEVRSMEVEYSAVQDVSQAATLARYDLENTREFLTIDVVCKPHLMTARVGDAVTVNLPNVDTPDQKCVVVGRSIDPQSLEVRLNLRSERDAKHAYALGETAEAPASPGLVGSYNPFDPDAPGHDVWLMQGISIATDGGGDPTKATSVPALRITGGSDDPNTATIICEYRLYESGLDDNENWVLHAEAPHNTTKFDILNVSDKQQYQGNIRYRSVVGFFTPRLILGPVTAGEMKIGWDGVNFPKDANGLLDPYAVGWSEGIYNTTLAQRLKDLANAQANATLIYDAGISTLNNAVTSLWDQVDLVSPMANTVGSRIISLTANSANTAIRLDALEAINTDANGVSLSSRIGLLENAVVTANSATASRVGALETAVGTPVGGNLFSRVASFEQAMSNGTIANATSINEIRSIANAANTAAANANTTASTVSARIGSVSGTVADALAGKADSSRVTTLENTINTPTTGLAAKVQSHDTVIVNLPSNYATASSFQTLQANTVQMGGNISALQTVTSNGTFATASQISSLTANAGALKSQIVTLQDVTTGPTGLGAQWGVQTNVNGHLVGLRIFNNGTTKSEVGIQADRFYIRDSGGSGSIPFVVTSGAVQVNTNLVVTGSILGGAVTGVSTATSGGVGPIYGSEVNGGAGYFTNVAGGPVVVWVFVQMVNFDLAAHGVTCNLYCQGSYVEGTSDKLTSDHSSTISFFGLANPGVGTHVYQVNLSSPDGGPIYSYKSRIIMMELKR